VSWIIVRTDTGEQVTPLYAPSSYEDRQSAYDAMVADAIWRKSSNGDAYPVDVREVEPVSESDIEEVKLSKRMRNTTRRMISEGGTREDVTLYVSGFYSVPWARAQEVYDELSSASLPVAPVRTYDVGVRPGESDPSVAVGLAVIVTLCAIAGWIIFGWAAYSACAVVPLLSRRAFGGAGSFLPIPLRTNGHGAVDTFHLALEMGDEISEHGAPFVSTAPVIMEGDNPVLSSRLDRHTAYWYEMRGRTCAQCGVLFARHPAGDGLSECAGDFPDEPSGKVRAPSADEISRWAREGRASFDSYAEGWLYCVADDSVFVVDGNRDAFTLSEAMSIARNLKDHYASQGVPEEDAIVCVHPYRTESL